MTRSKLTEENLFYSAFAISKWNAIAACQMVGLRNAEIPHVCVWYECQESVTSCSLDKTGIFESSRCSMTAAYMKGEKQEEDEIFLTGYLR